MGKYRNSVDEAAHTLASPRMTLWITGTHRCGRAAPRARSQRISRSSGTSWSAEVSEPCMPISEDSRRSALLAMIANGPAGAATTSPIRPASAGFTGPNQPAADRLVPRQHPGPVADDLGPGGQHVRRRRRAGRTRAWPGARRRACATPSRSSGSASTSIRSSRRHVDHAVVGGHVQRGARGQRRGELLGQLVDVAEVEAPGVGRGPEGVPGAVELPVIDGDQRAVGVPQRFRRLGHQRAQAVGGPVLGARA